jgi:hypothetical protein
MRACNADMSFGMQECTPMLGVKLEIRLLFYKIPGWEYLGNKQKQMI